MDPGFAAKDRVIHAVWSHLHPLCTNFALYKCAGKTRQPVFSNNEETSTANGLEIKRIDYLSSKEGIPMPGHVPYELEVTYNNTTGEPQDSMSVAGIFFDDTTFARPDWVFHSTPMAVNCMVNNQCQAKKLATLTGPITPTTVPSGPDLPLFDKSKDGPLLTGKKLVELKTNAGPLTLELDATGAPLTSTQMYRLFTTHAFDGTSICSYNPNYLIQFALAEDKASGQPAIPEKLKDELRRLPVEPAPTPGNPRHKKDALTIAHDPSRKDSGSSSFSIMLMDAPHLDNDYTCFGQIIENASTKKTLSNIASHWGSGKFWILSSRAL
jgi:cyclophilin family peptidyl-prolyl cis-trans isomerase